MYCIDNNWSLEYDHAGPGVRDNYQSDNDNNNDNSNSGMIQYDHLTIQI